MTYASSQTRGDPSATTHTDKLLCVALRELAVEVQGIVEVHQYPQIFDDVAKILPIEQAICTGNRL